MPQIAKTKFQKMNIWIVSYSLFIRRAGLVSASHFFEKKRVSIKTLKQVQGDMGFMKLCEHSNFKITETK